MKSGVAIETQMRLEQIAATGARSHKALQRVHQPENTDLNMFQ